MRLSLNILFERFGERLKSAEQGDVFNTVLKFLKEVPNLLKAKNGKFTIPPKLACFACSVGFVAYAVLLPCTKND